MGKIETSKSYKSHWALTKEQAVQASKDANPAQYYTESAIDNCFANVKAATRKGLFTTKVSFSSSEEPYVMKAIKVVEEAGFTVSFVADSHLTVLISWEA